jgi:hypothetical protein
MSQQELLKKVIQVLEEIGIEYMLTGSIVSSLQGEPRSTHDIDIIVVIEKSLADKLVEFFPFPDFYLDKNSILNAIDGQEMFNLIDVKEGNKVDFWILSNEPYDRSRFLRKYTEEFSRIKMQVSSPEDTILAKLRWAKLSGGSEKQFTDALRVYEIQFEKLDKDYLEFWGKELGIVPLLERLKNEAEIEKG